MTVDELVQRLQSLGHPDWEIHLETMKTGGVAMLITNLGVRTEIHWRVPVNNNVGIPIPGRFSQGF